MSNENGKAGRPRKMTPAIKAKLLADITAGASRQDACILSRISLDTLRREEGRDHDFADSLKVAEVDCKMVHIAKVSNGPWQASSSCRPRSAATAKPSTQGRWRRLAALQANTGCRYARDGSNARRDPNARRCPALARRSEGTR